MATLTLNLPAQIEATLTRRAKESGYTTVEAYVLDLLHADASNPPLSESELESLLQDRLNAQGQAYTPAFFDHIRDRIRGRRP